MAVIVEATVRLVVAVRKVSGGIHKDDFMAAMNELDYSFNSMDNRLEVADTSIIDFEIVGFEAENC